MDEDEPQGAILAPWSIKDMPRDMSSKAVAYARRHQITVAQVVAEALALRLDPHASSRPVVIPAKTLTVPELLALAQTTMPAWLRTAARRELGAMLGVEPPAPPTKRLPAQSDAHLATRAKIPHPVSDESED